MTNEACCSIVTTFCRIILFRQGYHGYSCKVIWPLSLLIYIRADFTHFLHCFLSWVLQHFCWNFIHSHCLPSFISEIAAKISVFSNVGPFCSSSTSSSICKSSTFDFPSLSYKHSMYALHLSLT